MAGGGRAAGRLLALAALVVGSATLPASAAPPSGEAAPVVSASSLAAKVTTLTAKVTQLEGRLGELERQVRAAAGAVTTMSGKVGVDALEASKLLAAAQAEALDLYTGGDPAKSTFALAAAVAQDDPNDVAWSLTLIQSTNGQALKLARAARKRAGVADASLTEAIATRDRLTAERARVDELLLAARQAVSDAEIELQDYVRRLGPGTIAGMTTVAYDAYRAAEARVRTDQPACGLRWELLAAIGKTESNHAQGRIAPNGDTAPPILGIPIGPDTDLGAIDTDPKVDHAVGPMQFIPQTWTRWGSDGNNDGVVNINNIYDETLAAGRYLCAAASGDTLFTRAGVIKAIWAYNPNEEYLRVVGGRFEALASDLAAGWFSAADLPTPSTPADDGARRPVATPSTETLLATTTVTAFAPFSAGGVAVAAVSADALPAICGQSAVMSARAGVYRCQPVTVDPVNPANTTPSGAVLDPCLAAPYDAGLLACAGDPEQAVTLVRTGTPAAAAVAGGPPYFLIVLEGGDRCRPVAAGGALTGNAGFGPASSRPASSRPASSGSGPVDPGVPSASSGRPLANAQAATTTTTTTTTTTVGPTTTRPVVTTTTSTTVAAPAATTTTTTPATTTSATAPAATPETTVAPTTTTTAPAPAGTLAAPAASPGVYRCSSGAEIVGQPVAGQVAGPAAGAAGGTSSATSVTPSAAPTSPEAVPSATLSVVWTVSVQQAGVPARTVPVLTLVG